MGLFPVSYSLVRSTQAIENIPHKNSVSPSKQIEDIIVPANREENMY